MLHLRLPCFGCNNFIHWLRQRMCGLLEAGRSILEKVVEDAARKYGDSPFLLFRDQKISFREVNDNANRIAQGLLKLGIKKGDKVVIIMPNCPEIIYAWFGIAKMGGGRGSSEYRPPGRYPQIHDQQC